jgi:peptidyl-prolyl cis-trans isomerase B (cyclophilin B)
MAKIVVLEIEGKKPVEIELDEASAPLTVANFEKLVKEHFYDGLTFHRVIQGFMIQGGCPLGNGTGSSKDRIKGEFLANGVNNQIKHLPGVISMARSMDYNSASCQFFIVTGKASHLDGNYAAFGKVISNLDEILTIEKVPTDYKDKPITRVVINRMYMKD